MKPITLIAIAGLAAALACRADTKALYEDQCQKCHGADGKGQTKMGQKLGVKDYTDAKVVAEMKDDQAFKNMKNGMKEGEKVLMKPFDKLSDQEIKDLIVFMRGFAKK
jgi:mono/diheme cytochrome c family protein